MCLSYGVLLWALLDPFEVLTFESYHDFSCFYQLAIANHEDCYFKIQNQDSGAYYRKKKVTASRYSCSLKTITYVLLIMLIVELRPFIVDSNQLL